MRSGLEMDALQELKDKQELADLVSRLSRAVDRADREGIIECYADESFDDHGRFRGNGVEFADFICGSTFTAASPFVLHVLGQMLFDIDGDEAFGETIYTFYMQTDENLHHSIGRYVDYFERINGRWVIVYRRVIMEWHGKIPFVEVPWGGHAKGTKDKDDPVYQKLKWPTDKVKGQ